MNDETKRAPVLPNVCGNCKHWAKWDAAYPEECKNETVRGMVTADYGYDFTPPADFGCNKWEAK